MKSAELDNFIKNNPNLIGREREFVYAVQMIEDSLGTSADFGIIGEPFIGKRQFCRALYKWFKDKRLKCKIQDVRDNVAFYGDIVFLLDADPCDPKDSTKDDAYREKIKSYASRGNFVVYSSTKTNLGSGETLVLQNLSSERSLLIIENLTGYSDMVASVSKRMQIPIPESPLIVKSLSNNLLGCMADDAKQIEHLLDLHARQKLASSFIPRNELDEWRKVYGKINSRCWKASRCGMRFFIRNDDTKDELDGLVRCGIAKTEGPGILFSEAMCTLSHGIWGEPCAEDYRDALTLNLDAIKTNEKLPNSFYDDAVRITSIILDVSMAMNIGIDMVLLYIMELIRYRIYDKNHPLACIYLLQNSESLKELKKKFDYIEKKLITETKWDSDLRTAINDFMENYAPADSIKLDDALSEIKKFIAREIKCTVNQRMLASLSSEVQRTSDPSHISYVAGIPELYEEICTLIRNFDNLYCLVDYKSKCEGAGLDFRREFKELFSGIRLLIDGTMITVDKTFEKDENCKTRTVMGFQKTLPSIKGVDDRTRQTLWTHLLWDEFEINARWFNLTTIDGYRESSRLIKCIDYIHDVNSSYPLCEFKPVNEEMDFSSVTMYSELLNPVIFKIKFEKPNWYKDKINYKLGDQDRSVIYSKKTDRCIKWENSTNWDEVTNEVSDEVSDDEKKSWMDYIDSTLNAEEVDELIQMNLRKDLFHYFRLYCEADSENMNRHIEKMEEIHRQIDPDFYWQIFAQITLELSRAELLCNRTVKSQEYFNIVKKMNADGFTDSDSVLNRVAYLDTEARIEYALGKKRSAIRKMEDLRKMCSEYGLVSQYVVIGTHLYNAYGPENIEDGKSNRRIGKRRLEEELNNYLSMLENSVESKESEICGYKLIMTIIKNTIKKENGDGDQKSYKLNEPQTADSKHKHDSDGNSAP